LPDRNVVTVLTEVVVDADDPAFAHPTKPIGPVYTAAAAA
jgi:carbamate kinase